MKELLFKNFAFALYNFESIFLISHQPSINSWIENPEMSTKTTNPFNICQKFVLHGKYLSWRKSFLSWGNCIVCWHGSQRHTPSDKHIERKYPVKIKADFKRFVKSQISHRKDNVKLLKGSIFPKLDPLQEFLFVSGWQEKIV